MGATRQGCGDVPSDLADWLLISCFGIEFASGPRTSSEKDARPFTRQHEGSGRHHGDHEDEDRDEDEPVQRAQENAGGPAPAADERRPGPHS